MRAKRVAIIGAGASGVFSALFVKKYHPEYEVELFEKEGKLARKLGATGNGHCNILAKTLSSERYSSSFVEPIFKEFPLNRLKTELESLPLPLMERKEGIYPLSYSAPTLVSLLEKLLFASKAKLHLGVRILDYLPGRAGYRLLTSEGQAGPFDELLIATGGSSTPRLGSDGSFFDLLGRHGYKINVPRPALSPIIVKDGGLGVLKGVRHQVKARLEMPGGVPYSEDGEILFRNDGLSGILAFNLSSILTWDDAWDSSLLHLDLFPDIDLESLAGKIAVSQARGLVLPVGIFEEKLADYLASRSKKEGKAVPELAKDLTFRPLKPSGFEESQVTHGGVALEEIDERLSSRRERGIYLLGEILDVDGLCGGYNLSWAIATALKVALGI